MVTVSRSGTKNEPKLRTFWAYRRGSPCSCKRDHLPFHLHSKWRSWNLERESARSWAGRRSCSTPWSSTWDLTAQTRAGNSDSGPTSVSLPVKKSYANHCLHLLECMRPEDSQCCHGTQGDLESSTPTSELHVPQRELSLFTQWDTDNQEHTEFHCSTIIYEMDWRLWTDVSASWLQHEWHHQSPDHMLWPLQPSQRPQNPKPHLS